MTDTPPPSLPADLLEKLAAVGNKAVNDHWHEDLCMCDTWPEKCLSSGNYFFGTWDTSAFAIALPAIIAAYEQQKTAPAEPCTAHANGLACARTDDPDHSRHIAADSRYWWEPEPCKHDDCTSLDCDPEPSVHCGATNDAGDECFLLEHASRTDHAYPES